MAAAARHRRGRRALLSCVGAACLVALRCRSLAYVPGPHLAAEARGGARAAVAGDAHLPVGAAAAPVGAAALSCALGCSAEAAQMPLAPSGVNGLPESEQALVVLAIFAVLGLGSLALLALFDQLKRALPEGWFSAWQRTWPLLGFIYMAAGSAHFTAKDAFESIYPPPGTWGFWYLPGSAEFHVAWTGVAELLGGAGLFLGAIVLALADAFNWTLPPIVRELHVLSALGLLVLTLVVSPANIFMYTHGAQMVGLTPGDATIPVEGHYIRCVLQVLLLSILWRYYVDNRPTAADGTTAS